jgi:ADP-ribose pyrophosphatase
MGEAIVTHTGPVFRVESRTTIDATGRRVRRDIVRHPGAVAVLAIFPGGESDPRVVLIRNRRIAVDRELVECCAGKLERGEDPACAAARELEEECGLACTSLRFLGGFFTSPGFSDERMHVFLAEGLIEVARRLEPGEEIESLRVSSREVDEMIRDGRIEDAKTIAAWTLWRLAERGA